MLTKLENGRLKYLPKTYTHDGVTYSNYDLLPEETLLSHGWKLLIKTEMPEPEEGVGYRPVYTDNGDNITMSWEPYEIPPEPEPIPDYTEFIGGLMEGYKND